MSGLADPDNHSTLGSRPELLSDAWPTPTALSRVRNEETMEKCLKFRQSNGQTTVPLYLEERVNIEENSRPESWLTPRANEPAADANFVARNADRGEHCHVSLTSQAKAWATPRAEMDSGAHRGKLDTLHSQMKMQATGKLNPRWVCVLMNLPVFWVKP
jgi:hypothetical protein